MAQVFQIWLNDHPPPERVLRWMESWKRVACGEYVLLGMDDFKHYSTPQSFESANSYCPPRGEGVRCKYRLISNIMRYEAMYRHGGLYVDVDVEPAPDFSMSEFGDDASLYTYRPNHDRRINGVLWFPSSGHSLMDRMRARSCAPMSEKTSGMINGPIILTREMRRSNVATRHWPFVSDDACSTGETRMTVWQRWAGRDMKATFLEQT